MENIFAGEFVMSRRPKEIHLFKFSINEAEIKDAEKKFGHSKHLVDYCIVRAMDRAVTPLMNEIAEKTSRTYLITKQRVKRGLRANTYGGNYGRGVLLYASADKPLASSYEISPRKRPYSRMHGLYVGIKRQGGLKLIPNAFLLKDNLPMLRRKGSGKEWKYEGYYLYNTWKGLHYVYGPSIAGIAKNPENLPEALEKAQETFAKRFQHEVLYRLGVFKK